MKSVAGRVRISKAERSGVGAAPKPHQNSAKQQPCSAASGLVHARTKDGAAHAHVCAAHLHRLLKVAAHPHATVGDREEHSQLVWSVANLQLANSAGKHSRQTVSIYSFLPRQTIGQPVQQQQVSTTASPRPANKGGISFAALGPAGRALTSPRPT